MKIHLISDVHLEFFKKAHIDYAAPEGTNVVVMAGDICTGVRGVTWAQEVFAGIPVIYVPGNHEYYGKRVIDKHIETMKEKALDSNVHVVNDQCVCINDVMFVCSTLWTDYNLYGTQTISVLNARMRMNDYRQIYDRPGVLFTPDASVDRHTASVEFISNALRVYEDFKCVVVTHHAPTHLSVHEKYLGDPLNPAYASNLAHIMDLYAPKLWLHGHVHNSFDYMVYDKTRVVTNPRGYDLGGGNSENTEFDKNLLIEI